MLIATLIAATTLVTTGVNAAEHQIDVANITGTIDGYTSGVRGGAISNSIASAVEDATLTNNKITSDYYGGAIYSTGEITISGTNIFSNNQAQGGYGGAIAQRGANISTDIGETIFSNNSVTANGQYGGYGGAIIIQNSFDTPSAKAIFKTDNAATVKFENNQAGIAAGALYLDNGADATLGSGTSFTGNKALANSEEWGGGGAIAINSNAGYENSTLTLNGTKFELNEGYNGGAIRNTATVGGSHGIIISNSGTSFISNTARKNGGAIYVESGSEATIAGTTFTGNRAIGSHDEPDAEGMVNYSGGAGGAIYNAGTITVGGTFGGETAASGNSALHGGAIYNSRALTVSEGTTFSYNKAAIEGGAIANYGNLTIGDNVTFDHNIVDPESNPEPRTGDWKIGAGIYSEGTSSAQRSITIGSGVKFTNNSSAKDGGALFLFGNNNVTIGDNAEFSGNSAARYGGAIMISDAEGISGMAPNGKVTLRIGDNAKFTNNTTTNSGYGSAIEINKIGNTVVIGKNAVFSGNTNVAIHNAGSLTLGDGAKITGNNTPRWNISGVWNANDSTFKATNVEFSDNEGIALWNQGNSTINGGSFTGNTSAHANAGAVNNSAQGTLTLNNDVIFSNNKRDGNVANDIHNLGILNINGNVEFDAGITGEGTVNLGGSSYLNFIDNEVTGTSVLTAKTLNITNGAKIALDWGDKISVSDAISGAVKISDLYVDSTILSAADSGVQKIDFFTNKTATIDVSEISLYGAEGKYSIAQGTSGEEGKLVLSKESTQGGLAAAIDDTKNETLFSFSGETDQDISSAGDVDTGNLNIIGDSSSADTNQINLSGGKAITVDSGHTLNVKDAKIVDANTTPIAYTINNAGTTNLVDSIIDKINNTGTLNIEHSKNVTINTVLTGSSGTLNFATDKTVTWDTTDKGQIEQSTFKFIGDGHVTLKGDGIKGNIVNEMTGNTLVLEEAVDGNWTNNSADSHAQFKDGAAVSGTVTNDGTLDILTAVGTPYEIKNGIVNTDTTKGILNIGDGSSTTLEMAAKLTGGNIVQKELNILSNAKLITNASALQITDDIQNAGTLELTSGTLTDKVRGDGTTVIKATDYVKLSANVFQNVDVQSGQLRTKANNLKAGATNEAGTSIRLEGGVLATDISGDGKTFLSNNSAGGVTVNSGVTITQETGGVTVISGGAGKTVTNKGTIKAHTTNNANSNFDNEGTIYNGVTNNGTVNNKADGTIYGGFTNNGTATNEGTSDKQAYIGTVYNKSGATFTNGAYGLVATKLDNEGGAIVNNNELGVISVLNNFANGSVKNNANAIITNLTNKASGNVENAGLLTNTYNYGTIINKVGTNNGRFTDIVNNYSTGVITTIADGFDSTAVVTNDGIINLTGSDDSTAPITLSSNITSATAAASGIVNITGNVAVAESGNGSLIEKQGKINVGTITPDPLDPTQEIVTPGYLANAGTVKANNINITEDSTINNTGKIVSDGKITNDGTLINDNVIEGDSDYPDIVNDGILSNTENGFMDVTDITNSGIFTNDGDIDSTDITNSGAFANNGRIDTNDRDITNSGTMNLQSGSVLADEIINETTDPSNPAVTTISGGDVDVNSIINNSGTTDITGGNVNASSDITNNGGVTNINTAVTTPEINADVATPGTTSTVNINADGDSSTSDKIGNAVVNVSNSAEVAANTNSDNYSVNNAVNGSNDGVLALNGKDNSGYQTADDSAKTKFTIDAPVSNATVAVNQGQLNLPNENNLNNATINVAPSATLNTMDGSNNTYNSAVVFDDKSEVKFDVDALAQNSDAFASPTENGNEVLTDVSIANLDKIVHRNTDISLAGTSGLKNLTVSEELQNRKFQAMTPIRMMEATIGANGMLNIHPSSGRNDYNSFNSAAVVAPVAAQIGGYLTQLNSYDEAFKNLDMKMLMTREERQAYKMANLYASSEVKPMVFSETYLPEKDSAGWFRPYASFEKVGLKNGPKVENIMYGTYLGGDSQMYETKNGWDYQYSVYAGYNGSHQNYDGNSIYQNGGTLGVTSIWYKNDFFTALTANVGAGVADASTMFGNEDFPMLMTGIASKTGYNWELAHGKFIIQPSYLMSYTFVNTFNYTNAAGVRIHTDPLHAINIAPGLKFIGNFKNGWQPYASVSMIWNIMNKSDFQANDIPLPEMSVRPYIQYGVGVQKRWGERFTGFGQVMMRNGGRNGVALSAGFRLAIGKNSANKKSEKTSIKNSKNVIKNVSMGKNKSIKRSGSLRRINGDLTYVVTISKNA